MSKRFPMTQGVAPLMMALVFLMFVLPVQAGTTAAAPAQNALAAFRSERELVKYFERLGKQLGPRSKSSAAGDDLLQQIIVTGHRVESITNNQTDAVDEGGIVKLHGDHLVVLRRGRLFTVSVKEGELRPISWVNAYGPGINPDSSWYDEVLIHGSRIVVIGYSYERGGTELGLFDIDDHGRLRYDATYHLKSNDYYSSRNYASRLVDGKLILYSPLYFRGDVTSLPALRRWNEFAKADKADKPDDGFHRIASATQVFRPVHPLSAANRPTLHTITTCDLAAAELTCKAVVALGPAGRTFYVSSTAVYIWLTDWSKNRAAGGATGVLYRMPLDSSSPTAVPVSGAPTDQFSFFEDSGGILNVLVRAESQGDAMWSAERAAGSIALLQMPIADFGHGMQRTSWSRYRPLPQPEEGDFHNRFVGEYVLYGSGDGWGFPAGKSAKLFAASLRSNELAQLDLPHSVDRIEPMGTDAVIVGTDAKQTLHFSGVRLARTPRLRQHHEIKKAAQGELRSHGFFYKSASPDSGILALPIQGAGGPGFSHLIEDSAAIVFVRNQDDRFDELGQLFGGIEDSDDDADGCQASCVDWYGNARPIFLRNRIFALLGYELIEGSLQNGKLQQLRRAPFAPMVNE